MSTKLARLMGPHITRSPLARGTSRPVTTSALEAAQLSVATDGDSASWLAVAGGEGRVLLALLGMIDWCALVRERAKADSKQLDRFNNKTATQGTDARLGTRYAGCGKRPFKSVARVASSKSVPFHLRFASKRALPEKRRATPQETRAPTRNDREQPDPLGTTNRRSETAWKSVV